jgi:exopolysaccharide biosynthesis WecB/TagA/CpsF family protein
MSWDRVGEHVQVDERALGAAGVLARRHGRDDARRPERPARRASGVAGMNWSRSREAQVTVNVANEAALLDDIARRLAEGRGFSVATLNLDHVVKLGRYPAFRAAYAAHSHVTADGNSVVWLSRLAGQREVALVPGSDLIAPVAALAARAGAPVGLFGATEASLAAAARALKAMTPGLEIALTLAPPMGFDPAGEAADCSIRAIAESGARVVFLALGAPKQECFAARAQLLLPGTGFLSIGAGLDFLSGAQKRAPAWVRAVAAEWLWRLADNPRRLGGRYAACLAALPTLTLQALAEGQAHRDNAG